jgi:endogenous inhibitor of DNA gyrase (YacG/DUF329 family)
MKDKRRRERVIKECLTCGVQMDFPNWVLKTRKYCSKECSIESMKKGARIVNCKVCNKEIEVPLNNKTRKYCSKECQDESKRKETIGVCTFCKKEFKSKPPHEKRKYCSKRCQGDYFKIAYKGERNPSFNRKRSKEEILMRTNITIELWKNPSFRENVFKGLKIAQTNSIKEFGVNLGWNPKSIEKKKRLCN